MPKKNILLTARGSEFEVDVIIDDKKYYVQTDFMAGKWQTIVTNIYDRGTILFSLKKQVDEGIGKDELHRLMKEQLHQALEKLKSKSEPEILSPEIPSPEIPSPEIPSPEIPSPEEYISEAQNLMNTRKQKDAYKVIVAGLKNHKNHPLLMSYFGLLEAFVRHKYYYGTLVCRKAITVIKAQNDSFSREQMSITYLNLGKILHDSGKKKEAFDILNEGLKLYPSSREIHFEIELFGKRRDPVLRFLPRSHPANKFLGIIRHKLSATAEE